MIKYSMWRFTEITGPDIKFHHSHRVMAAGITDPLPHNIIHPDPQPHDGLRHDAEPGIVARVREIARGDPDNQYIMVADQGEHAHGPGPPAPELPCVQSQVPHGTLQPLRPSTTPGTDAHTVAVLPHGEG